MISLLSPNYYVLTTFYITYTYCANLQEKTSKFRLFNHQYKKNPKEVICTNINFFKNSTSILICNFNIK